MSRSVTIFSLLLLFLIPVSSLMAQTATYDTVSIYDLQWVADPASNETSVYYGDTVVVRGMIMHSPRELYVAERWAAFIVDPDSFPNPWSGYFIIQHDCTKVATNFGFLEPGMICYFTGWVDEFSGLTQHNILTNPPVAITVESAGNPLPDPLVLDCADLSTVAEGEQWESMWVDLRDITVVNNNYSSNRAIVTDVTTEETFIGDYFLWFRSRFDNSTYQWPSAGTLLDVQGFVRANSDGFSVDPQDTSFVTVKTNPPLISNVMRDPGVPLSGTDVTVSATIVDNGAVSVTKLWYSVNWGAFIELPMTATADTFSAVIPVQANNSYVRYFIFSEDDVGDNTTTPGDTSNGVFSYVVRDGGLSIKDIQYTWGYSFDGSPFDGYEVTVSGVVTTDSTDFIGSYYIQEKDSAWYGIWVDDLLNTFEKGDQVEVTGVVDEQFGVTRIESVVSSTKTASGQSFAPVTVTTEEVSTTGANGEAYESLLLRFTNLTVTDPYPDAPSNFGEFEVDDGSGPVRIDDNIYNTERGAFKGNLYDAYHLNDTIAEIIAIGYYSFGDYKHVPRDTSDVIGHVVNSIEDREKFANTFKLNQNFPNPFNPTTQIDYFIAKAGNYTVSIYNILGQKIRTLVSDFHGIGNKNLVWDGLDNNGKVQGSGIYFYTLNGEGISLTKKMILIK